MALIKTNKTIEEKAEVCPVPIREEGKVLLAHGEGGKLTQQLIESLFLPMFDNEYLNERHDGSVFEISGIKFAFTTDSFVVKPPFFPGGDIGELAVNGTVNDVAMCGAKPLFISAGFIIEEGLPLDDLEKISRSMKKAADEAGVKIITGDTKVVCAGKGDKIYINTSGIGIIQRDIEINPQKCKPGDVIIINGNIADHGVAVLSARVGLRFDNEVKSDTTALNDLIDKILDASDQVHVLRDPTRGGIATTLNEIAISSNTGITIYEKDIPLNNQVKSACEILGVDPLYVANEGKVLVVLPKEEAEKVLAAMKEHPLGKDSAIIGKVTSDEPGSIMYKTKMGSSKIMDMVSGEQLPRIC